MHAATRAYSEIHAHLSADVREANALLADKPNSHFAKRILIRTLFTYLEGCLHARKQETLALEEILCAYQFPRGESRILIFSEAEKHMLRETTFDLSGSKARETTYYPKLGDNIKFTLTLFQRAFRLEDKIDYNCPGWTKLLAAQKLRNRLTHPKSVECLKIEDEDLSNLEAAIDWYEAAFTSCTDRISTESVYRHAIPQDEV